MSRQPARRLEHLRLAGIPRHSGTFSFGPGPGECAMDATSARHCETFGAITVTERDMAAPTAPVGGAPCGMGGKAGLVCGMEGA